jgi:hypothetical protein
MRKIRNWTPEEESLLREKYPVCSRAELSALFPEREVRHIIEKAKRLRLKKAVRRYRFTPEVTEEIIRDYAGVESTELSRRYGCSLRAMYGFSHRHGLKKSRKLIASKAKERISGNPNHQGRKYWFKKGCTPFNKGRKMEEWMSEEGVEHSEATRFKKGQKPIQTLYDGAITVRSDHDRREYKYIRMAECEWEPLHRHVWELHHGAVPEGYNITFRDGNTTNCNIENLECISNAELMERNRISSYPVELQTAIRTRNKIIKKIRKNGKKQD